MVFVHKKGLQTKMSEVLLQFRLKMISKKNNTLMCIVSFYLSVYS